MTPEFFRRNLIASSIALALGSTCAEAALVTNVLGANTWSTDSANFTLLVSNGGTFGATNDLSMVWDGNAYNAASDYTGPGGVSNVTISTTTPFLGYTWTAHDIQVFLPGSYSFDTALGGGNGESGVMDITVGPGQLGMHLLWDWASNYNIDVSMVFAQNSVFGSGLLYSTVKHTTTGAFMCSASYSGAIAQNCLYDGHNYSSAGAPIKNQVWTLASTDADGDGVMGVPMASGGPFASPTAGLYINFNANLTPTPKLSAVPIPAAVWLFGSGLFGLITAGCRKKLRKRE